MRPNEPDGPRTWLVTGGGRGIGRAIVEGALAAGDRVAATVRDLAAHRDLAERDGLVVLELDVRERARVGETVAAAVGALGRLDVVVNNAGSGIVGTTEELSEAEVREHLDTNLLGAYWVTQAALPHLRAAGRGDIVQISTTGAVGTMPALGLYNAGKWALEAFSEALAAEVDGLGIGVTIAELGSFDTAWAGSSMRFAAPLAAYDDLRTAVFGSPVVPWPASDPADGPAGSPPAVAAEALLRHLARPREQRPLRLLVGDDAPAQVAAALERRRDDYALDDRFVWPS